MARGENNAMRRRRAQRERMEPQTYVKLRNGRGHVCVYPMRYLIPAERADFLRRATSPL